MEDEPIAFAPTAGFNSLDPNLPEILLVAGRCLLCDPDAALMLRSRHRLLGSFTGRRRPGSKPEPTMPILLLNEEAALALSKGWARLSRFEASSRRNVEGRARCSREGLDKLPGEPSHVGGKGAFRVDIHLMPEQHASVAQPLETWSFPCTEMDLIRAAVFEDLHNKGLWLTSGLKYGGDFLAYEGDPQVHHAAFIVVVVPRGKQLLPAQIISIGRVGNAASKSSLVSSLDAAGKPFHIQISFSSHLEPSRRGQATLFK